MEPIRTAEQHEEALKRAIQLWNCAEGTKEAEEFDALVSAIDEYEKVHYPIPAPTEEESSAFRAEQENRR